MPTNNEEYSPISESENDELILFIFIQRILFPMMATAVLGITITDIYFLSDAVKNKRANIITFFILFPWPEMGFFIFTINSLLTTFTICKLFKQNSLKCCSCECFLITLTLLLLFGIVYLVFNGFWIIIALLVYPGSILIGGIFVVQFLLATISTWNLLIKVIENCCCCKGSEWSFLIFFKSLMLLFVGTVFWGLFIATLIFISRFLLHSSVNLETKTLQSLVYSVIVSAVSGILTLFNTYLTKHLKNNGQNDDNEEEKEFELESLKQQ